MQLHLETEIAAPAQRVWEVLAHNFASIDQWASVVDKCRPMDRGEVPDGWTVAPGVPVPGRVTTTKFATAKEVLVEYSEADREFTFDTADLPRILKMAKNHSKVSEVGPNQSVVSFDIEIVPTGPARLFAPRAMQHFRLVELVLRTPSASSFRAAVSGRWSL